MTIDNVRWQTLSALFDRALDLTPGEREALIARECAGDAGLAAQLRRMLDAADADSPLDGAASAMVALEDEPEPAQVGDRLGGWILDGEIGRGGMGVVHAAHRDDGDTHQRAAIKRLRMRWDGSPQAQRFAHERRILARLSHPNIPRLLDHGVDAAGRPWFAQEFIDGRDLLAHADENRLDLRARIELFRQVCAAVQHAHEHFVVHRDLKPSNILVDPDGHAKVQDFGVAKRLDAEDAESTRTGAGAGYTPQYAAPEQVTGEAITAATDVYALGVILYQLLSGRLPYAFDAGNLSALAQAITARTPERLDKAIAEGDAAAIRDRLQARATSEPAFRRFVRGDLSRIVQTALAKEPQRRYSSVLQMSLDLRRFLSGRPVSVAGNSFGYRTGKFVQRNRWAVALGTLALGAVLAGSIVSVVQMRRAQESARLAGIERDNARTEAERSQAVRDHLLLMFRESGSDAGQRSARDVLTTSADQVFNMYRDDPGAGLDVANSLGSIHATFSDVTAAGELYRAVLARPDIGRFPEQRARAWLGLANVEHAQARHPEAKRLLADAQAFWTGDAQRWRKDLLESRALQAKLERDGGDAAKAVQTLRAAWQEALAANAGKPSRESLYYQASMVFVMALAGDPAGARKVGEEALAGYRALGLGETADGIGALNNLMTAKMFSGDIAGALVDARQAWELRKRLFPRSADTATTGLNYAAMLVKVGRLQEARDVGEAALAMAVDSAGARSRNAMVARVFLADVQTQLDGDEARVVALMREQERQMPEMALSPMERAALLRMSGIAKVFDGRPAEALKDLTESEALFKQLGPVGEPSLKNLRDWIARAQRGR